MIDLALSVLALVAGGLTLEIYSATGAPLGYRGEPGFHRDTNAHEPDETHLSESPS